MTHQQPSIRLNPGARPNVHVVNAGSIASDLSGVKKEKMYVKKECVYDVVTSKFG